MTSATPAVRQTLNKVPEITVFFWVIKILCTTIGESLADYLSETLGVGLVRTTLIMAAVLIVALGVQFQLRRYVPGVYWTVVALVSVVGTLVTDNLTDNLGVSLWISTGVFTVLLLLMFGLWYRSERTVSIHTIVTTRREAFYWGVVMVTFALGTATGDLLIDTVQTGLLAAVLVFAAALAVVFAGWKAGLGTTVAFWIAYVLTRPLGGSLGDFLSGDRAEGGAGLGTLLTSLLFLSAIVATVVYLSVTKRDQTERAHA